MKNLPNFLAAFFVLCCCNPTFAILELNAGVGGTISDSRSAGIPVFEVNAGDTVTVNLFVTQSGTFTTNIAVNDFTLDDFRLSTSDPDGDGDVNSGVGSFVVNVAGTVLSGTGASSDLSILSPVFGAGFRDDGQSGIDGSQFRLSAFGGTDPTILDPVFAAQDRTAPRGSIEENSVLLASIDIETSNSATGEYQVSFSNPDDGVNDFILGSDAFGSPTASPEAGFVNIRISTIPEPSSLLILGLGATALTVTRRKRN